MNVTPTEVAAWTTAVGAVGAGAAVLRRRYSRDSTEIRKDRTESKFLDQLIDDASEVRKAWRERQADAAAIAKLQERNRALEKELAVLTMEFEAFKRMMVRNFPDAAAFLSSAFAPLSDK